MEVVDAVKIKYKNIKENMYSIDEYGNVYSFFRKRFMIPSTDKDGYLQLGLSTNDNKRKWVRIAQLVTYHFIGECPSNIKDITTNHKDGNILNNHYTNLKWMERSLNASIRFHKPKGENNKMSILTEEQVKIYVI